MNYKFILIGTLQLFILTNLYNQENLLKNHLFIEGSYHYGFVSPHHNTIAYFVDEHIQSLQINIGFRTSGNKEWHKIYNCPAIGIGYHYSGLSNKDVFGNLNAIYGFVSRDFLKSKSFNLGNQVSMGIGFVNNPYNLNSNPFNMAISSHINIYAQYSLYSRICLYKKTYFKTGVTITHISNGNTKKPNLGLNFITAHTGFGFYLNKPQYNNVTARKLSDSARNQLYITPFAGFKSITRLNNIHYPVYGLSIAYSYKLYKNNWLGIDISNYFDKSLTHEISYIKPEYSPKNSDNWRSTINVIYEMGLGNISILIQPGIYLRNKYSEPGTISNKAGLRYRITKNCYASFLIKAHWRAIADVVEWGVAYRIKK